MKLLLIIGAVAVMVTVTVLLGFSGKKVLKVGDPAPLFELKDQNNTTRRLTDYIGKRLVVYFFLKQIPLGELRKLAGSATYMTNMANMTLLCWVSAMISQRPYSRLKINMNYPSIFCVITINLFQNNMGLAGYLSPAV